MKYMLERHAYAPELNAIFRHTGDRWIQVAKASSSIEGNSFSSLAEWRSKNRPVSQPVVWAEIQTHYQDPKMHAFERRHVGRVMHRRDALAYARRIRKGLVAGGTVMVRTRLVG